MSDLNPAGFLADLESKPDGLGSLADDIDRDDPWEGVPAAARAFVFVGMGSSYYACALAAARLRARGIFAVAELASSELLPAPTADTVIVAVSASGRSRETAAALERYVGSSPIVALTNTPASPLTDVADRVVAMRAGQEAGGVACRSFQHTVALLLALEDRLAGRERSSAPSAIRRSAEASADLLARRPEWLLTVRRLLSGSAHGIFTSAPAHRLSSAQQAALMLREGPRIPAVGCETGDWSHVDVYLTKTLDYRLLLFAGSRWEDEMLRWTAERDSTVVAVGADVPDAAFALRYAGDDSDDVRLLTEVLVAELLAQDLWARPT